MNQKSTPIPSAPGPRAFLARPCRLQAFRWLAVVVVLCTGALTLGLALSPAAQAGGYGGESAEEEGVWVTAGQGACSHNYPNRICADWLTDGGRITVSCCIDPSNIESNSYLACLDFRPSHTVFDEGEHPILSPGTL